MKGSGEKFLVLSVNDEQALADLLPFEGRKEMQLGVPLDMIERDETPRGA